MDQFGLNMNFLGIKQVIVIIFTLKINFHICLSNFSAPWTARIKSDKCRVRYVKFPKTQTNSGLDRGLDSRKIRVSYIKPVSRRGIRPPEPSDQNPMSTIRSSRYYNRTRHWPLDPDPTVDIHLTLDQSCPHDLISMARINYMQYLNV